MTGGDKFPSDYKHGGNTFMGITSSNKQINVDRIDCDGTLKVTLAFSAFSPPPPISLRILPISFWYWIVPAAWQVVRLSI